MTDIANLEREAAAAERRAVALKKFVEVAKDLGDDGLAEVIGLLSEQANGRTTNGNGRQDESPDKPAGREAIRRIVSERPGVWTMAELKAEMVSRGWFTTDKGIEAAVSRLIRLNKAGKRLGRGRIKFFPPTGVGDAP